MSVTAKDILAILDALRASLGARVEGDVRVAPTALRRPRARAGASARRGTPSRSAASRGRGFAGFGDLGTYRLLLSMTEPDALRAFADSLLAAEAEG